MPRRPGVGMGSLLPLMLLPLLLLLLAGGPEPVGAQPARASDCPVFCVCSVWLRLNKASCTGRRLYSIHTGVSHLVQALDLSNNSISQLEDKQLSRAGLTRLKFLNLSMNVITEIGLSAFHDLKSLMVLDLSMNRIDYIESNTFYYNSNLQILNLAGNKFNLHVPKLRSTSITDLDLSGCRIRYLPKETFVELKELRTLNLSNNMLTELHREVLSTLPNLQSLLLGRNFWSCNEIMFSLKSYLRHSNIRTDPVCEKPTLEAKFEKIISLKSIADELARPSTTTRKPEERRLAEVKMPWDLDSAWNPEELEHVRVEQPMLPSPESGFIAETFGKVSPFWFLLTGFLLGSSATMLVTYLWLSTTVSRLVTRIRRADPLNTPEANSQRVSLLRHLWQQENLPSSEESSRGSDGTTTLFLPASATTPSCPGTPPPPYREVMLQRNLAAMVAAAQQQLPARALDRE